MSVPSNSVFSEIMFASGSRMASHKSMYLLKKMNAMSF